MREAQWQDTFSFQLSIFGSCILCVYVCAYCLPLMICLFFFCWSLWDLLRIAQREINWIEIVVCTLRWFLSQFLLFFLRFGLCTRIIRCFFAYKWKSSTTFFRSSAKCFSDISLELVWRKYIPPPEWPFLSLQILVPPHIENDDEDKNEMGYFCFVPLFQSW